jgi:nicotinate-nucleotide adenylyltransferase
MIADEAIKLKKLNSVMLIPAGDPYMKDHSVLLPGKTRYQMAVEACRTNPKLTVSTIEIDRKGQSYTIDTLDKIREQIDPREDQLFLIMGDDNLLDILSWKSAQRIMNMCNILVFVRDSSTRKAAEMTAKFLNESHGANIEIMNTRCMHISSTDIRNRIENDRSYRYLVSEPVYNYILDHELYGAKNEGVRTIWT